MKKGRKIFYLLIVSFLLMIGCSSSKNQFDTNAKKAAIDISVDEEPGLYNTMATKARGGPARGVLLPITGKAVSLAKDAVKNFIAKENERYTETYVSAQSDLFFYDETSEEHPLDPTGLQFKGVKVLRSKGLDTLFYASFEIDTSRSFEIINNSIFRLKVKDLVIKQTDLPSNKRAIFPWTWFEKPSQTVNYDINIKVFASWINEAVEMHRNVQVGEFFLLLRNAPLKGSESYSEFIAQQISNELDGFSYLIPRSVSFQQVNRRSQKLYGHGLYSIQVEVVESRKKGKLTNTATSVIQEAEL